MSKLVTATFKTRDAAERTLLELESIGVTDEQISLVVTDETRGNTFNIEKTSSVEDGLATGATTGGLLGAILGSFATATAFTIPGLNLVIAGTVVSAFAGLGAGAVAGGLVGALTGAGVPQHKAKVIEEEVKKGGILLAVHPESDEQEERIENVLEEQDAYNIAA